MHDVSRMIADRGDGNAAGSLMVGFIGATALAVLVLASGFGLIAAFLAYSFGGAAIVLAATLGRAALVPARTAPARRRPAGPAASTFA